MYLLTGVLCLIGVFWSASMPGFMTRIVRQPAVFGPIAGAGAVVGPALPVGFNTAPFGRFGRVPGIDSIVIEAERSDLTPRVIAQGPLCYVGYLRFGVGPIGWATVLVFVWFVAGFDRRARRAKRGFRVVLIHFAGACLLSLLTAAAYAAARAFWTGAVEEQSRRLTEHAHTLGQNAWAHEFLASGSWANLALAAAMLWTLAIALRAWRTRLLGRPDPSPPSPNRRAARLATIVLLPALWLAPWSITYTLAPHLYQIRVLDESLGLHWIVEERRPQRAGALRDSAGR